MYALHRLHLFYAPAKQIYRPSLGINPVRAQRVNHPGKYPWSSYASHATGKADSLLTPHPLYVALGRDQNAREFAYREVFQMHIDTGEVHAIREALNQERVLGREDFKDRIAQMIARQIRRGESGRPRAEEEAAIYYVFY